MEKQKIIDEKKLMKKIKYQLLLNVLDFTLDKSEQVLKTLKVAKNNLDELSEIYDNRKAKLNQLEKDLKYLINKKQKNK